MRKLTLSIAACTLLLYAGAIFLGLHLHSVNLDHLGDPASAKTSWHPASLTSLPDDQRSAVELGRRLFTDTPLYAPVHVASRLACSNCHLQAGTAPYALPVVASAHTFPQFSKRAARNITLEDRVQECMTRSENADPLPPNSPELHALLAYIDWLSKPHPDQLPFVGRTLQLLPALGPDPTHGAQLYAAQCAGCHGVHGEGTRRPFPPLWGPDAFNDGAGMDRPDKLAAFIHTNMPQNRKGILSPQDATDLAAFLHNQPRPAFNHAYDHF